MRYGEDIFKIFYNRILIKFTLLAAILLNTLHYLPSK